MDFFNTPGKPKTPDDPPPKKSKSKSKSSSSHKKTLKSPPKLSEPKSPNK